MNLHRNLVLLAALAAACLFQAQLTAGDKKDVPGKDVVVNGELTQADLKDKKRVNSFCKTYTYKMVEGRSYQIDMKSKDFDSYLRLENSAGDEVAFDDDGGGFPDARIIYKALKSGDYTIICTTFGGNSTGKFNLTVKDLQGKPPEPIKDGKFPFDKKNVDPPVKVNIKPIALKAGKDNLGEYKGELTNDDAQYQGRKICKVFTFKMEEGKTYKIDHSSKKFDAYLYLEDPAGAVVDQNDDNGESLDSRIIYKALKTGEYRIVATSLGGRGTGEFTLTVRPATDAEIRQSSLRKSVEKLFTANPDDRKRLAKDVVKDVTKYLEDQGQSITRMDAQLAMGVAQVLEFSKEEKAAGEACTQFAKLIAKAKDRDVAETGRLMEGMGRRLSLLGNEMQVQGKLLDGKDFDLKSLKGKVVLVDFWATWCGPCVGEIPHIKKMYAKYNKDGFEVIGISLDDSPETVKNFIAKQELPWGCIFDGIGKNSAGLSQKYGVMSIPLAILVGRDGRVISMQARGPELTRLLEEAFEKKK